jgi:hypothetical protein
MSSKDTIVAAIRWIGREQSYQALCREIAWTAARSAGSDRDDLDWLVPLVERRLAEHIEDLPLVVRRSSLAAEREHLVIRPHDDDGAELVADSAARDAAIEHVSTAYMDALDWAVGVLRDRQAVKAGRVGRRRSLRRQQLVEDPVECDVPERILDGLTRRSTRPGWPDRRAA